MSARSFRPARRLVLQAACAALAAACARPARRGPDADETRWQRTAPGYQDAPPHEEEHLRSVWREGEEEVALEWLLPRGLDRAPLVVYLPGLGEAADAGVAWRRAWARAGHAVLSFQAGGDAAVWSSTAARRGDFAAIVRDRFGVQALSERIVRTRRLLDELARRAGDAAPPFGRIDARRVAVAGFDLGAQTALALAGHGYGDLDAAARAALEMPALRASIAFALPVRALGDDPQAPLRAVHTPLMLVTGRDLDDSHAPSRVPVGALPFEALPAGDKYLLTLEHAARATLSGADQARVREGREGRGAPPGGGGMGGGPPGGGGGGRGPGAGARPGPGGPGGGRGGPPPEGEHAGPPPGGERERTLVAQVTTAFLDACLRDQPRARDWLAGDAEGWIGDAGQLRQR